MNNIIKIKYKEFESEYKKNSENNIGLKLLNDFIQSNNNINIISIEENIYFNIKKTKISRIILYYNLNNNNNNNKNNNKNLSIIKININNEKLKIDEIMKNFNIFLNKNKNKLINYNNNNNCKLLNTSTNHYIENKKLNVRITFFFIIEQ